MRRRFLFNKDVEKSLVITANEPSTVTFNVYALGTCECNLNNTGWVEYTPTTYSLNAGETISFKGDLIISTTSIDQGVGIFRIDGNVDLYGSPIYLLAEQFLKNYAFASLFASCDIRNVSSTFLPSTTLASACYYGMFEGCTSLITAPELPATTLASACYESMFDDCTSLTTTPKLPATTLASACYYGMFEGCTSLITAPELPATTLASACYESMFEGCTSLITAPELPATTLATCCYDQMFRGCSNLNYIKMLANDISATDCLYNWVSGVASSGTFVKNPAMTTLPTATLSNNYAGIPSGWTVVNDGEESGGGGKIVNHGVLSADKFGTITILWEYPVESLITVSMIFNNDALEILTAKGASKSGSSLLGPGQSLDSFNSISIEPNEDDTYIYEVTIEV